nr:MAG TPA: hypothetical protein [Caudoviricetes sp.]DAN23014.1 MAG TPA_asm: hypothetical protein [Bacteriophage sp.]
MHYIGKNNFQKIFLKLLNYAIDYIIELCYSYLNK